MKERGHDIRTANGFTLVELLVVVMIITILVALLLPALKSAVDSARDITCKNRNRQLHVMLMTYADDYGNRLMAAHDDHQPWGTDTAFWKNLAYYEYMPPRYDLTTCPSSGRAVKEMTFSAGGSDADVDRLANMFTLGVNRWERLSMYTRPSLQMVLLEKTPDKYFWSMHCAYPRTDHGPRGRLDGKAFRHRRGETQNLLFLDGHVNWIENDLQWWDDGVWLNPRYTDYQRWGRGPWGWVWHAGYRDWPGGTPGF